MKLRFQTYNASKDVIGAFHNVLLMKTPISLSNALLSKATRWQKLYSYWLAKATRCFLMQRVVATRNDPFGLPYTCSTVHRVVLYESISCHSFTSAAHWYSACPNIIMRIRFCLFVCLFCSVSCFFFFFFFSFCFSWVKTLTVAYAYSVQTNKASLHWFIGVHGNDVNDRSGVTIMIEICAIGYELMIIITGIFIHFSTHYFIICILAYFSFHSSTILCHINIRLWNC